ncbi:MAG: phosphorelay protein [Alphaproteobacteria bacterium]|nr:phosphorelay protein [Alphaproteobacteria bacterium]
MAQEPEYIYPPNNLKSKITVDSSSVGVVAMQDAEAAITDMAEDYLGWVKDDIANLQGAYDKAVADPSAGADAREEMYGFAHDIKGQGGSFGYPLMTAVGNQLCKFMEGIEGNLNAAQLSVVKVHIDTLRLIIQERMEGDGGKAGSQLLRALDAVIAKVKEMG